MNAKLGDSMQREGHFIFPSAQLICHGKCSQCFSKLLFFLRPSSDPKTNQTILYKKHKETRYNYHDGAVTAWLLSLYGEV